MKQIKQVVKPDLEDRYTLWCCSIRLASWIQALSQFAFISVRQRQKVFFFYWRGSSIHKSRNSFKQGKELNRGPEPSKKKAKQKRKFLSLLEDVLDKLGTTHADISPQEVANNEIQKYLCNANWKENSTMWWKIYCIQLSLLATVAWLYLCIPATSVPSKHSFSTAGNIVNAKCSCLLPENKNILTGMAQNLD